jgi:hyperosmotically inducible periplasmic protein
MNTKKQWAALTLLVLMAGCQEKQSGSVNTEVDRTTKEVVRDADNTARNVRDRDDATLTPGDQGNSPADREITHKIRKTLVSGPTDYSVTAKNIKIITVNGKATLRGPVKTEAEKAAIVSLAKTIAGESNVDDQLEVKTNP